MAASTIDLRVADLMSIDPITADGRPIGVISAMDFVALAAEG